MEETDLKWKGEKAHKISMPSCKLKCPSDGGPKQGRVEKGSTGGQDLACLIDGGGGSVGLVEGVVGRQRREIDEERTPLACKPL